jgi:hypothetical protein
MDGHGTSPIGRCEGIPDPNEVSSLGKLSVFLKSHNLITLNDIIPDLGKLISHKKVLTSGVISAKVWLSKKRI